MQRRQRTDRQRGAAMVEFVVVGPMITALGLAVLQYSLMFFAKSQINHASFMAARAGSVAHADLGAIEAAYKKALIPLYGGGQNAPELAAAYARATADLTADTMRVEILNPTKESFDDYATDKTLNERYGARAIPNIGLAVRPSLDSVKANSGQTLQDANLLKLRITHGYEPKVWLIGSIYKKYLQWLDSGSDEFNTRLIDGGRIPIVAHVTLAMHSDAVEAGNLSMPGLGNDGRPVDSGNSATANKNPPSCESMGCSVVYTPSNPAGNIGGDGTGNGSGQGGSGDCSDDSCRACEGSAG